MASENIKSDKCKYDDLMSKITIAPNGCWEMPTKYRARVQINGHKVYAYRFVWEYVNGIKAPEKLEACHTCDNGNCINPNHIFWGTHADNMHDRDKKGRNGKTQSYSLKRRAANRNRKLTDENIADIVRLYKTGLYTQKDIARMKRIGEATVYKALRKNGICYTRHKSQMPSNWISMNV